MFYFFEYVLYKIFLMPYLERDKYFNELCDSTEKESEEIALKILLEQKRKKQYYNEIFNK